MKPCKDCGIKDRYVTPSGKIYSYCYDCNYIRLRKHQNTEKGRSTLRKSMRNYNRKKNGFTPELFDELLIKQNYKCAICEIEITISSHADHNHTTGKARGILCHSCNTLLGRIESKGFDWIEKAKRYLENF